MTAVTFSSSIGGDGSTYSDGVGVGGMAEGGHRLYFFPLLTQYVAVAAFTAAKAQAAADAAVTAANAPGTSATTTSSITVGTGTKSFTLAQTGKLFAVGQRVVVASNANALNSIAGPITAFTSNTGAMTINCDTTSGSGTYTDGVVSVSASGGVPSTRTITGGGLATGGGDMTANRIITVTEALAADIRAGTNKTKVLTTGDTYDALAVVTLQFGANITTVGDASLDGSKFINAQVTLAGNFTLPNIANAVPGMFARIKFIQDATGGRIMSAWGNAYKAEGGKPTLSTAPGAADFLYFDIVSSGEIVVSQIKGPSN